MGVDGIMVVVFCDVDGVLRMGKGEVTLDTQEAVRQFHIAGGIFNMITGAPLAHVPDLPAHLIFAEAGGVWTMPEREGVYVFESGRRGIARLRERLGIDVDDGIVQTRWGSVLLEGPRHTSLTLLFGQPPHYPGTTTSACVETLKEVIARAAWENDLTMSMGADTYIYIDVFSMTKKQAIVTTMRQAGWHEVYMLGDRLPDYEAMLLPGVIPVGFCNSIPEIRILSQKRGVYIDLPGPDGGVAQFFRALTKG